MRTALRSNEAAQGLFKLIAAFGAGGYRAALLLVRYDFDMPRAALEMGLADGCKECASGRGHQDAKRGCQTCFTRLRQRVHRLEERAHRILGEKMPVTRHTRTRVVYGADGRSSFHNTGNSIYETTAGSLETGDPEEFGGPEGE